MFENRKNVNGYGGLDERTDGRVKIKAMSVAPGFHCAAGKVKRRKKKTSGSFHQLTSIV